MAIGTVLPAAAQAQGMQAQFDAATAAASAGRCAEALQGFARIERSPAAKRPGVLRSAIALRKGSCLAKLDRSAEATPLLRAGVEGLAGAGEQFAAEVAEGHLTLARIARRDFDYASAIDSAEAALALSTGDRRIDPLLQLAALKLFDGDGAAERHAAEAVAIVRARPDAPKDSLAAVGTLHARALLNQRQYDAAYTELTDALELQGGLTRRVSLADVATRADLSLAALLLDRREQARKYLAYTGAGRMAKSPFATARSMDLPFCSEEKGLTEADYAVVQFSLSDTGEVSTADPVFATGGRDAALAFAEAVRSWSWAPEDVAAIPEFFRRLTRVELRCSSAAATNGVTAPLQQAFDAWLAGAGAPPFDVSQPDARILAQASAEIVRPGLPPAEALRAAAWLAGSSLLPEKPRRGHLERARALATELGAPVAARAHLDLIADGFDPHGLGDHLAAMNALLARPDYAADPLVSTTLRLLVAAAAAKRDPERAEALLVAASEEPGLPAAHPLRTNAMLQRANLAAKRGDLATAQASFERTGLTEQQCALIGPRPAMRASNVSFADYPREALMMGFEGWARVEFDIAADGRTAQQRAVIAYPPFVFGDAAARMSRDMRFEPSFRPENGIACAASQTNIRFENP